MSDGMLMKASLVPMCVTSTQRAQPSDRRVCTVHQVGFCECSEQSVSQDLGKCTLAARQQDTRGVRHVFLSALSVFLDLVICIQRSRSGPGVFLGVLCAADMCVLRARWHGSMRSMRSMRGGFIFRSRAGQWQGVCFVLASHLQWESAYCNVY
jgi:hypothetical protein